MDSLKSHDRLLLGLDKSWEVGHEFCNHWYNRAIRSQLEPMKKVAKKLKKHPENILSWVRYRIINSRAEGVNSRSQAIKSSALSFRSFTRMNNSDLQFY